MARKSPRGDADCEKTLRPLRCRCPACGSRMWADYNNRRTVVTLQQTIRLTLRVRRCHHAGCPRYRKPYRPEAEGRYALPQHEFGLDVIALGGVLRDREHLSVPEISVRLVRKHGLAICERTVTNLLDRYDELLAVSLADDQRLSSLLSEQGWADENLGFIANGVVTVDERWRTLDRPSVVSRFGLSRFCRRPIVAFVSPTQA